MPVPQPVHKYPTRHKKCLKTLYNYVNPDLIASHTQKTSEEMIDRQYVNMLANSIINDETGYSLEYRHLIKIDKQKNTWVEYFPMS